MLALYLVLFTACSLFIPRFLSSFNLSSLLQSITSTGIVACGMMFCLASADFDLSVGSVAAFSAIVTVMVTNALTPIDAASHSPFPMCIGMICGLATGAGFGLVNGFIIARLKINALITTLATMQIVRGLAHMVSQHHPVGSGNLPFNRLFGSATFLSLPSPVWLIAFCFLFFGIVLHLTVFGRQTLAIGGNFEAARRSGINTTRVKILIFALQGSLAALAGIVEASQLHIADPKADVGLELSVIAACVLGGVSLTGGVATILAVIIGTLIMGTVQNAMSLKAVDTDYQYLVTGGILLAATLYDRLKQRLTRQT
jgi:L-arabinose transport system permease protein